MIGLLAMEGFIVVNVIVALLLGWKRDGVAPWRGEFWKS